MKTRIITAAVLVPLLLLLVIVLPKIITVLVVSAFAALAAYELLYCTGYVRHIRLVAYSMLAAFLMPIWCYCGCPYVWGTLGFLAFLCAMFAEIMITAGKLRFEKVCLCLFAGVLLPYLFSALIRIFATEFIGRHLLMIPCILAFLPDSGAYFAGRFFGKHKLAPVISPNKTVEGALGAIATGIVGMLLYSLILDLGFDWPVNYGSALLYGVVVPVADIYGDLMFSVLKRQTGIKDYGNLFPGHGGILDRFDSMMLVAPLCEVLLIVMPIVG